MPLSGQSLLTSAGERVEVGVGVEAGGEAWVEAGAVAGVKAEAGVEAGVDVDAMTINDFVDGLGCPFDPYPGPGDRS